MAPSESMTEDQDREAMRAETALRLGIADAIDSLELQHRLGGDREALIARVIGNLFAPDRLWAVGSYAAAVACGAIQRPQ